MSIKVGRHYRLRSGQTAFIKESVRVQYRDGGSGTQIFGLIEESGNLCMWNDKTGRRVPDQPGDHPDDLIALIGEEGT